MGKWWNFSIKYLVPIILVALLAAQFSTDLRTPYGGYPSWLLALGWSTVSIPLLMFVVLLVVNGRKKQEN